MGGDWKSIQLQDIVTVLGDGLHGTPKYDDEGEYYFINGNNLEDGRIVYRGKTKKVNRDQYLRYKKELTDRTILVSINGTLGNLAFYDKEKIVLGKSACYFNLIRSVDKRFIRYVLSGAGFKSYLESYATGTTIKNVSLRQMREYSFCLPPLPEQRAIAHILGTLDDKIELNRRMNETLEEIARAIFKSWFVDFDPVRAKVEGRDTGLPDHIADLFPDSLKDSELGEIPEGWKVLSFSDTIQIQGGGTPKTSEDDYWNGDIPWFTVVDAPNEGDIWVINTERSITKQGVDNSSTQVLPEGTTIVSARGTVGKIALVGLPMAMNQSCYGLIGKASKKGYFIYYSTRRLLTGFQKQAHGSVFDTITRNTFADITIAHPKDALINMFETEVEPILLRIKSGLFESQFLSSLRNTLLPKLISGELRIEDPERFLPVVSND